MDHSKLQVSTFPSGGRSIKGVIAMRINWASFALGAVVGLSAWATLKLTYLFGRFAQHQDVEDAYIRQAASEMDDDLRNIEGE